MIVLELCRYGISLYNFHITWLDLWTHRYGLELSWGWKCLLHIGFGERWGRCNAASFKYSNENR